MATHRRTTRSLAVLTAAITCTAIAAPAFAVGKGNPNTSDKFRDRVHVDAVVEHLEEFERLAYEHADTGFRASGTPGYEAASEYVEGVLRDAGLDVWRQEFDFDFYTELTPTVFEQVSPTPTTYVEGEDFITMSFSGSGDVTAVAVPVDIALGAGAANSSGCQADDFAGFPDGAIALMQRGGCPFADKAANAETAGASAAIVFNSGAEGATGVFAGTLSSPIVDIPVIGTSYDLGVAFAGTETVVRIAADTISEVRTTWNVLAQTTTGRTDNVVMLGAHLDSVTEGPGINDNGTGVAGILEVAKQLADVKKLNNQVRFAFWGAEERGLVGSWHYVEDLAANDPEGLASIAGYLNFDMIGSPNYIIGVYDGDESTYAAPVAVPDGSAAIEGIFTDHFDAIGQPWVDTIFSGRSDYQGFIVNGIPAGGLFTGADGVKTDEQVELFGGTAGVIYDPNYHTAADVLANVDIEALDIMTDAIAHAAITLGYDTSMINGERAPGRSGCAGKSCDAPGLQRGPLTDEAAA